MKKISVVIPTLNEEENVEPLSNAIIEEFGKIKKYDYEIVFIDNCSTDNTRKKLEKLCNVNKKIKAIFNKRNFGGIKSPIYGILQATGDAVIVLTADFQDPPELIPQLLKKWEQGFEVVCAVKKKLKEFFVMKTIRKTFYNFVAKYSEVEQIKHFDGVGLYDRVALEQIRELANVDNEIQLRNLPTDLGMKYDVVEFVHQKRKYGKTKNNIFALYEYAINVLVNYTKILFRGAIFLSGMLSILSLILFCITLYFSLDVGINNVILMAYFAELSMFLTSMVLFFIGVLGEYIDNIKSRVTKRPFVVEEKRINF